jgi:SAM-dependent methyltransferase
MYERIRSALFFPLRGKILGISGIKNFYHIIDKAKAEVLEVNYPEVDMQKLPFEDSFFDFVISDQVIEHLENPMKAVKESTRVLKGGGTAIVTTCFLNPLHPSPQDYWRFTPDGLRVLVPGDGIQIIECGGWGNRLALLMILLRDSARFMDIPPRGIKHRLAVWNEKKYPIVTWVVFRKSA